ncbi:aldehyde dehydrogenase family protein [Methanobrevibacter acididurans]|uniref:aldehyde dehydrogenase family protein n=1 Tax=Methanobrevibacter acididurans TaxID=120963 RepID=UPI0038FCD988
METTRIRKTENDVQYEELIDEYITRGYKTEQRGEKTCNLMKPNYGSTPSHLIVAIPAGAPFGGWKQSGIGRETHKVILDHYTQMKNIMINLSENPSGFYPKK